MFTVEALVDNVFWDTSVLEGYVHSVFDSAVNLDFIMSDGEHRLFTLLSSNSSLLPDCAILPPDCSFGFHTLSLTDEVQKKENRLIFKNKSSLMLYRLQLPHYELKLEPQLIQKNALPIIYQNLRDFFQHVQKPSGFSKLPMRFQTTLYRFATAIISSDLLTLQESFESLVGSGIGLTPTCDDAMTGVLGLSFGAFANGLLPGGVEQYFKLTKPILHLLVTGEQKTTRVSEKYLKCACRGNFPPDMGQLVKSALSGNLYSFTCTVRNIASIGHTSGMDILTGVLIFTDCLNNRPVR